MIQKSNFGDTCQKSKGQFFLCVNIKTHWTLLSWHPHYDTVSKTAQAIACLSSDIYKQKPWKICI